MSWNTSFASKSLSIRIKTKNMRMSIKCQEKISTSCRLFFFLPRTMTKRSLVCLKTKAGNFALGPNMSLRLAGISIFSWSQNQLSLIMKAFFKKRRRNSWTCAKLTPWRSLRISLLSINAKNRMDAIWIKACACVNNRYKSKIKWKSSIKLIIKWLKRRKLK